MITIGIDPHKQSHTAAAVNSPTGELRDQLTIASDQAGHERLIEWARALGEERLFALEDCRHVSGRLERELIARGERVIRVPPKLMAGARRSAREFGKSDPIDALAVARAALRERDLPVAHLDPRLARSSSCSITARTSSASAPHRSSGFAGTFTTSRRALSQSCAACEPKARVARSPTDWPAVSRPSRSRSAASCSGESLRSPGASASLRPRSGAWCAPTARSCSSCRAAAGSPRRSSSARSPARSASHPTPSSPVIRAARRCPPPRAKVGAIGSPDAATASSTAPFTGSRSPRPASIPTLALIWTESAPRGSQPARRFAA